MRRGRARARGARAAALAGLLGCACGADIAAEEAPAEPGPGEARMQAAAEAWAAHGRAILAFERAERVLDEEIEAIEDHARARGWDGPARRRVAALRWESARMRRAARRERAAREAGAIAQTLGTSTGGTRPGGAGAPEGARAKTGESPGAAGAAGLEDGRTTPAAPPGASGTAQGTTPARAERPRPSTAARGAAQAAVGGMLESPSGAGAQVLEGEREVPAPRPSPAARAAADAAVRGMTPAPEPAPAIRGERSREATRAARAAARGEQRRSPRIAGAESREAARAAQAAARVARGEPQEPPERQTGTPVWAWALMIYAAIAASVMAAMWGYRLAQRQPLWFVRKAERGRAPALARAGRRSGKLEAGERALFVERERNSRFARVRAEIERRYPLLDAGEALGKAALIGGGAMVGGVTACWMLKIPVTGVLGVGAALGGFLWGGWASLRWQQRRREALFAKQFPETVDQIVRLAGAGVPSVEALAVVTEDSENPVKAVLGEVNDALRGGVDAEKALRMTTERIRLAEFTMFAAVLRLQRRSGGGVTRAFGNLSETLRNRRKTELQRQASTAQTRLTIIVLAAMPALVLLVQKVTSPESVEVLFGTESGTMLLRWGAGLVVAGVFTARWIGARGMR